MSDPVAFIVFLVVPMLLLWGLIVMDLLRRTDLSTSKKLLWALIALILAEIGALIYIACRPLRYPEDRVSSDVDSEPIAHLIRAAEAYRRGELSDADMTDVKVRLLAGSGKG